MHSATYMYIYIYIHIYIYIDTYIYMYIYIRILVYSAPVVQTVTAPYTAHEKQVSCLNITNSVCLTSCVYPHTFVYHWYIMYTTCIFICVCVCVYICIHLYIYVIYTKLSTQNCHEMNKCSKCHELIHTIRCLWEWSS